MILKTIQKLGVKYQFIKLNKGFRIDQITEEKTTKLYFFDETIAEGQWVNILVNLEKEAA